MPSSFQSAYTAACVLNNAGVSLSSRGYYQESLEVFQDALMVMKDVTSSLSPPVSCEKFLGSGERVVSSEYYPALKRARQMLASCVGNTDNPQSNKICVISEDESSARLSSLLRDQEAFFSGSSYLIRIELRENPLPLCESRQDVDLEAALILFNFANAHKLMAEATTPYCKTRSTDYYHGANNLFDLSLSLLVPTLSNDDTPEGHIPLAILALRGLLHLALSAGRQNDVELYYSQILEVEQNFWEMNILFDSSTDLVAAAA